MAYIRLDYVEATGTQRLPTGQYVLNNADNVTFEFDGSYNTDHWFGSNYYLECKVRSHLGAALGSRHVFKVDYRNKTRTRYLDGVAKSTATVTSSLTNVTIGLFGVGNSGRNWLTGANCDPIPGKVYWAKVYRNDVLIAHLVPAKRTDDGKVGMYDIINKTFQVPVSGDLVAGDASLFATLTYDGKEISKVKAGESAVLKCNGKIMAADVEVVCHSNGKIRYESGTIDVAEGQTATLSCYGKRMTDDIVVEDAGL